MERMSLQNRRPFYTVVDGLPYPGAFIAEHIHGAINYQPRDDDVILATFPKCGTTWMQYILTVMFRQGKPFSGVGEFFRLTPFMEMSGIKDIKSMHRPGVMKTHLPYHLTPKSSKAKYIYIARNPKDCCVSLYHHTKMFDGYMFQDGTFEDFFEEFINGRVEYGDYFDHLMGWYERRNDPNVFFTTYEAMKTDTKKVVKDVARFLDQKYFDTLENNPEILDNVLRYSSFEHMKVDTNEMWTVFMNPGNFSLDSLPEGMQDLLRRYVPPENEGNEEKEVKKATFVRKGIVGDWKNLMTEEQSKRLEQKFRERAKGSDVLDLWKSAGLFQN